MNDAIDILDVVALTEDQPERDLYRGQVGTVVESLAPGVFEVEFSDDEGRAYASLAVEANQLLMLYYEPVEAGQSLTLIAAVPEASADLVTFDRRHFPMGFRITVPY